MARKPRVEYPGAVYHIMSRADRHGQLFLDEQDRTTFLETLGESCIRQGWHLHAFVLLGNHYHFLLETPEPNLVVGMKWLQGTYTQRFNSRYREWGHLFQGRYKALLVQSDAGEYFATVATYIHLNPVRARLMDFVETPLARYPWSSFPHYLRPAMRPEWLHVDRVLGSLGWGDNAEGRAAYRRWMQKRTAEVLSPALPEALAEQWERLRHGWALGDDAFRDAMQIRADTRIRQYDRRSYLGAEAHLHDETEAQRLLDLGLNQLELKESDLARLRKNDPRKKVLAWLIRQRTSVRNDWICHKLEMGRAGNLYRHVADVKNETSPQIQAMLKKLKKAF